MAEHPFTADASSALDGPEWLARRRAEAAARLDALEWPTEREEIWRYSRIDEFDPARYRPFTLDELGAPGAEPAPGGGPIAAEAGAHAALVVVRNGRVVHRELDASLESKGVSVGGLATCDTAEAAGPLGRIAGASPDAFTLLNDAFLAGGALVKVPAGVVVERPIVVVHWCEGDGRASFPRTLVVAERDSECSVVERFASTGDHFTDAVVELDVGANAHVKYLSVQEHGPRTWSIGLQRSHLARDATVHAGAIALGGAYARLRSEARLEGEGAESNSIAVYFGDGDQMLDFRTLQDHDAPRTRSELLFKGAVEDTARSVYSGLVHLRRRAQKADARQTNRNLVLSEGAAAESIPNLVIEADDVKCSHGSTVGPIDDDQRYYLESRGVRPADAARLIVLGFFADVLARLPDAAMAERLAQAVSNKVGKLS